MAENRENTLLQAIAEGESVDNARTADEVFLKAIADGTEKPEEIRNRLQFWLNQIDGGGGNPNYVETIEGTPVNPWGDYEYYELQTMYQQNEISVRLAIHYNNGAVDRYVPADVFDSFIHRSNIQTDYISVKYIKASSTGIDAIIESDSIYDEEADEWSAEVFVGTPEYPGILKTVLTIIHHPLP